MGRTGILNRYQCNNEGCEITFFRDYNAKKCGICGSNDIIIVASNVGE